MPNVPAYRGPERRRAQPSPLQVSLAVTALAGVVFVTLCPIGLRPHLASADVERFGAYFVLGALAARVSGRRALSAAALVVLVAIALEAAQRFAPGRHARVSDATIKALGGGVGAAAVPLAYAARRQLARLGLPPQPTAAQTAET
jgi:hypothetical protein